MPFIIWDRLNRMVIDSGGRPIVFSTTAEANTCINRLKQHGADAQNPKPIYDIITVV